MLNPSYAFVIARSKSDEAIQFGAWGLDCYRSQ